MDDAILLFSLTMVTIPPCGAMGNRYCWTISAAGRGSKIISTHRRPRKKASLQNGKLQKTTRAQRNAAHV
jgi:hypothetical protein